MKKLLLLNIFFITLCFLATALPFELKAAETVEVPEVTDRTFNELNPLVLSGSRLTNTLSSPGGIISRVLLFAFPIAGLILFVMFIWGGFEILAGSATKKSVDAGKQRITAAIAGFLLLFVSYWIIQLIEVSFGVDIFLGNGSAIQGGGSSGPAAGGGATAPVID